jgi:glycosyltransferase involved in cell wall biosynthesis
VDELGPGVVSIIMASYNRAATLPRAIDSVLAQDYAAWELIIVDDGSTDETRAMLDECRDSRVLVVRHERNRGVTAAKNTGLDHIHGEWFTFVDSDDEILPDALGAMLAVVKAHPDVDAVTCNCIDTLTGEFSGLGLTHDGYVDFGDFTRAEGAHWGITKTRLLGGRRFDDRIPGLEGVLWLKIGAQARRYYLDRALKIYHKEGSDRVSDENEDLHRYLRMLLLLSEDDEYLTLLALGDPEGYEADVFLMTVANVVAGRRRRAWRFLRRFDGSLARKGFLLSACLLGRRWVECAFKMKRRLAGS